MLLTPKNQVLLALQEDAQNLDLTSQALFSIENPTIHAKIFPKISGIFSGIEIIEAYKNIFSVEAKIKNFIKEGEFFEKNQTLLELEGPIALILSIERTLLNFLSRTCAIATKTEQFCRKIKNPKIQLLATRKTTPLLKSFELDAVVAGGGKIHRRNLSDGILIKENHLTKISIEKALELAHKKRSPLHKIEIEVQDFKALDQVLASAFKPDIVMLDNFQPEEIKTALTKIKKQFLIEVSGGITLENIENYSDLDINFISVGALTHSAGSLDLSLDIL